MKKTFIISALALLSLGIVAKTDVLRMGNGLTSLETVVVGNPGNKADDTGYGVVAYPFKIGKFEVTAAQYVEFLNAKGKSDPDGGLWNNDMDRSLSADCLGCDIRRKGERGSYTYSVTSEFANRPVSHVSFWDACRFCNWMHNGQGDGDTETGAYTLNSYNGADARKIKRNLGAKWFIPNEDEWYKAAYLDPDKSGGVGYWNYPTRSDSNPGRDFAGSNAANYYDSNYLEPVYCRTEVGAFRNSPSAYGTFDQGGNVYEWTEGLTPPFLRFFWGGSFVADAGRNVRAPNQDVSSKSDVDYIGFRIAAAIPGTLTETVSGSDSTSIVQSTTIQFSRRPWPDPKTGKPFFPMGWFTWASDEADLDQLALEGANVVLFVNAWSDVDDDAQLNVNIKRMKQYLNHAQKRGIKVLPQIGGWHGAFTRNDTAEITRQQKWVTALCKHPALLGYQLYDEPEYTAGGSLREESRNKLKIFVDALQKTRDAIRQWDPNKNHLVQVVFNLVPLSSWTAYLPIVDAFQIDRYPCDSSQAYFGRRGEWGPLFMAWSMAHGAAALSGMPHLYNPSPCLQGIGLSHTEVGQLGVWRNPLYEETRYMAYSSLTVGGWGVFHWIRNASCPDIKKNVARLHTELRQLLPAFEQSYEKPPFIVSHNHEAITRDFLTDCISDISTLTLEDNKNYYLIASDNTGVFEDVSLRMKLPGIKDTKTRKASVLNEDWSRDINFDSVTGEWVITTHKMCFGDVNIWVIPKSAK